MNYNRKIIHRVEGFIRDEVYEQKDDEGNSNIITIAVWQNQEILNEAKKQLKWFWIKKPLMEIYKEAIESCLINPGFLLKSKQKSASFPLKIVLKKRI